MSLKTLLIDFEGDVTFSSNNKVTTLSKEELIDVEKIGLLYQLIC